MAENNHIIAIEHLSKSFGDNLILKDVNLAIKPGEKLCIVGGSGCGKTVLAKHFNGLLDPDEGRVFAFGKDLAETTEEELYAIRKKTGYVYQNNALFNSMNVYENVSLPLRESPYDIPAKNENEIEKKIESILNVVGLTKEYLERMPHEISGGEKKRVAIARATIINPPVIIYDEPTPGLDPTTLERIISLIDNLHKTYKNTTIALTHEEKLMTRISDRIVFIRNKSIYFDGKYNDFINSKDPEIIKFFREDEIEKRFKQEEQLS